MIKFRKRLKGRGLEELLQTTIESGLKLKVIKWTDLKRINVDTSVMEKNISYPTDGKLLSWHREISETCQGEWDPSPSELFACRETGIGYVAVLPSRPEDEESQGAAKESKGLS